MISSMKAKRRVNHRATKLEARRLRSFLRRFVSNLKRKRLSTNRRFPDLQKKSVLQVKKPGKNKPNSALLWLQVTQMSTAISKRTSVSRS